MWPYLWLALALSLVIVEGGVSTLTGIEFGDNFDQDYLTEQNGIAIAKTEVKLKQNAKKYSRFNISSRLKISLSLGYKSVKLLCLDLPHLESLDQHKDGSCF